MGIVSWFALRHSRAEALGGGIPGSWRDLPNPKPRRSRFAEYGGRPVRRRLLFQVMLLAVVGVLLTSTGCGIYNPRHGMILRGDWSLELNRVPWLNSRTKSYDEVGEGACAPGMVAEPPMASEGCVSGPGAAVGYPMPVAQRCVSGCRACSVPDQVAALPAPQEVAHSRFHPVPTRPVFTPWNCPMPEPEAAAPATPSPIQRPPQREVIPTPSASPSAMETSQRDRSVTSAAWIFQPDSSSGVTR